MVAHAQTSAYTPAVSYTATGGKIAAGSLASTETAAQRFLVGLTAQAGEQVASGTWASLMQRPVILGDVAAGTRAGVTVAGGVAEMAIVQTIPFAQVMKMGARALPYVGAAAAAYQIYDAYRIYKDNANVGQLQQDAGQVSTSASGTRCTGRNKPISGSSAPYVFVDNVSRDAACAAIIQQNLDYEAIYYPGAAFTGPMACDVGTSGACVRPSYLPGFGAYNIGSDYAPRTITVCPATTDALDPSRSRVAGSAPNIDGKCPTGLYTGVPFDTAGATVAGQSTVDKNKAAAIAKEALGVGVSASPLASPTASPTPSPVSGTELAPVVKGPATVAGPTTTTTTTPTGGTSTTTTTTTNYNITYAGDTYNYTTSKTESSPTATTTTSAPAPEVKVCGVPGSPACKIDETGTPSTMDKTAAEAALAAAQAARVSDINGSAGKDALPWQWPFALPVGACSAFHFDTVRLGAWTIDPCSSSNVALWRSLLAWYLAALTGLHIWRTAVELKGG